MNLLAALERSLPPGFTIEGALGRGATSRVYLARRSDSDERIVVKVMRPGTATSENAQRFFREMQILRKLEHPRIVPILEPGVADGALFFTMPHIAGETLRSWLQRERQLGVRDALLVARDVADALGHAHAKSVVHRDVKPENILLARDGGCLSAYLMDFGLAWAPSLTTQDALTASPRVIVGTPDYVSPEQVTGKRAEDWRGDLFSLGCVLHEMLAGRPPFSGGSAYAIMTRRLSEPAPDVRVFRPDVTDDVAAILRTALAVHPSDRFATGSTMRAALDTVLARLRDA